MSIAVQHEAPSQRLNYRIGAPLAVQMGNAEYQTVNWSMTDFLLRNYTGPAKINDIVFAEITVPFQGFEISFKAQARVVKIDNDSHTLLAEFVNLDDRAENILRTFVTGLMTGQMEAVDGVIRRLDVPVTPVSLKPDAPNTPEAKEAEARRRQRISTVYAVAGSVLTLILGFLIYANIFQMRTESAVLLAETDILLAPATGDISFVTPETNVPIQAGDPIISIRDPELEQDIKLAELRVNEAKLASDQASGASTNSVVSQELQAVNATIRSLENKLRVQREAMNRNRTLLGRGLISKRLYDESQTDYFEVEKDYNEAKQDAGKLQTSLTSAEQLKIIAKNELDLLKQQRNRLVVRAPTEGRVVKLSISGNASVRFGQPIGIYERFGKKQVQAYLTRDEALHVAKGDVVSIYFPSEHENVDHRVTDIDYLSRGIDEKKGEFIWQWKDERTVTVTLEPVNDEAAAEVSQFVAGSTAVVMFDKKPISRFFGSLF